MFAFENVVLWARLISYEGTGVQELDNVSESKLVGVVHSVEVVRPAVVEFRNGFPRPTLWPVRQPARTRKLNPFITTDNRTSVNVWVLIQRSGSDVSLEPAKLRGHSGSTRFTLIYVRVRR